MQDWYDAEDSTPRILCEVELSNGKKLNARFIMGDWETLEGEVIYPVRFRPLAIEVNTALYGYSFEEN